jgi:hypothetical protein
MEKYFKAEYDDRLNTLVLDYYAEVKDAELNLAEEGR